MSLVLTSRVENADDRRFWNIKVDYTPESGMAIVVEQGNGNDGILFEQEADLNQFITALNQARITFRESKDE